MLLRLLSIISLLSLNLYAESTLEKIQKSGRFVVCSESGQIPYEMRKNNGDWYGFDIEMMQSFSKSLHVALVMKDTNWDGIIPALISGKCDAIASSMVVTEERKSMVDFSDVIVNDGVLALSRINDHEIIIKNDNLSDFDLPGIRISVPQGTVSDFITQKSIKHATLLKYQTNADAFAAFVTRKTDIVVSDKSYIIMMNLMNQNRFHVFSYNLLTEDIALAFRKQDAELKDTFNKFLARWKKNGDLHKTYDYFFNSLAWRNN